MSSGSSGRYQSRLFNFVHQQSRRVTQQWEHTFRHLQVATKWGVEALLYPVYLLFQSSESSGKTLQTKEPQTRLKLQPNDTDFQPKIPNIDSPIQHVLEAVNYLSSNEDASTSAKTVESFKPLALLGVLRLKFADNKSINNANLTQLSDIAENQSGSLNPLHLSVVRGIATNLMDRRLVLVTADNEILDILTPQQQAKLEDRIINEVANYWKSWRLIVAKKETELLPQIHHLLAKLTDVNTDKNSILAEGRPKDSLNKDKLLAFLDIAFAKLELNALVPVQERSQEIVKVAQTQLNIFLYGKEQLAARGEITANTDGLETHTLNLQALIEAALNYFFGVGDRKTLDSTTSNERWLATSPFSQRVADRRFANASTQGKLSSSRFRKSLSKSSQLENQDLTDAPWLTWNDLFGDTVTIAQKPVTLSGRTNPALASSLSAGHFPQNHLTVKQPKVGSGLVRRNQKTSGKVSSAKQTRTSISQSKSESRKGEILHQQFHQSTQVEAQPDWIETKATSIGYEKHPLEQLLEWVDYVMLWLEERFVKIFQSLRQLWQGK
ncbi:MAG TPA: hypothetical protein VE944_24280 [Nostoc sp.]|uniref:hypothetical protein n=1 Tax=Nostoc sp. TaxID=1180 RepID=UPI002D6E4CA0|nr:hypothetical protein [Nostoc sp.]HYX17414.1 hypothetical protein [Nostoc sp.]